MKDFSGKVIERIKGRAVAGEVIALALAEVEGLSTHAREAFTELMGDTFGVTAVVKPINVMTPMDDVEARRFCMNTQLPYFPSGGFLVNNVSHAELQRFADLAPEIRKMQRYLTSIYAQTLRRSEEHDFE